MSRDELAAALRERVGASADQGWTVTEEPVDAPWFRFTFEHPLSASFTLTLLEKDNTMEQLDETLADPEFSIVARAPSPAPHAALMRLLRQRAGGHDWPPEVLGQVADILCVLDLLTQDEASWLAEAGPAWGVRGHS